MPGFLQRGQLNIFEAPLIVAEWIRLVVSKHQR